MPIGDHLRDVMDLYGSPKCPHTNAVLIAAGEKGVDLNCHTEDDWGPSSSVRSMSPLGIGPVLKDRSATNIGVMSCMSYLDDKGFGPSLVPRNGVIRAVMYQYAHIATDHVQPQAAASLKGSADESILNTAFDLLENLLTNPPDPKLGKGVFICGEFSLADIHWMSCVNVLEASGKGGLVSSRAKTSEWCAAVKDHDSTSKEAVKPYTFLPTKEEMDSNTLRNVGINVV